MFPAVVRQQYIQTLNKITKDKDIVSENKIKINLQYIFLKVRVKDG